MKQRYREIGRGLDDRGWYKIWLERIDGKQVGVNRARFVELKREGRILIQDDFQLAQRLSSCKADR